MVDRAVAHVLDDVLAVGVPGQPDPRQSLPAVLRHGVNVPLRLLDHRVEAVAAWRPQATWPGASTVEVLCGHPEQKFGVLLGSVA